MIADTVGRLLFIGALLLAFLVGLVAGTDLSPSYQPTSVVHSTGGPLTFPVTEPSAGQT